MKLKLFLVVLFTISGLVNAQKIKLKKDKVICDGVEILKYEFRDYKTELYLFELDSDEESVFIQWHNNETRDYRDDDYLKIHFLKLDLKMETSNADGSWKYTIKWLMENKLVNSEGQFDVDKIKLFIKKYDENITNRTIRTN